MGLYLTEVENTQRVAYRSQSVTYALNRVTCVRTYCVQVSPYQNNHNNDDTFEVEFFAMTFKYNFILERIFGAKGLTTKTVKPRTCTIDLIFDIFKN